ncbi:MAG: pilus assembly protein [Dissulfurispiraceae bacterium]
MKYMKAVLTVITILGCFLFSSALVSADETSIFMSTLQPNVLFILGNSNSMDEDFFGNALPSYCPGGKSVVAKQALTNIVNAYGDGMRLGLMTYNIDGGASAYSLANSPYFASFNPASYCPNPPVNATTGFDYCNDYCINGTLSSMNQCNSACQAENSQFNATSALIELSDWVSFPPNSYERQNYCPLIYPKTQSVPNPSYNPINTSFNMYYKSAWPCYGCGTYDMFAFSSPYNLHAQADGPYPPYITCHVDNTPQPVACNTYTAYYDKYGSVDTAAGLTNYDGSDSGQYVPTDSDIGNGFRTFGQNMTAQFVGYAWFVNTSPGNGYLHTACQTNDTNNDQVNALVAMLNPEVAACTNINNAWNDASAYLNCGGNLNTCGHIVNAGLTPTAGTLQSAITYFQSGLQGSPSPITNHCQQNFIVYTTDGVPSVDPSGNVNLNDDGVSLMPAALANIKTLQNLPVTVGGLSYNFEIPVYVLGMGLTGLSQTLLNEMAVAGNTAVNGQAYFANNAAQLTSSLQSTLADIVQRAFSFTTTSVASSRLADENYLYAASFDPVNFDSFWDGHITKYNVNANGSIGSAIWDAGSVLQGQTWSSRNIFTYKGGNLVAFNTGNITISDLGVSNVSQVAPIVGYIQGNPTYNPENWKLGDTFHSNILSIGSPSHYFNDTRDSNVNSSGLNAFAQFRANNQRTSANGLRVLIAGANDGQFHSFIAQGGNEYFSFVPPNLMPKLQYLTHTTNPTNQSHQYLADGPVVASDVWLGSGNGTSKLASDWHTLAVLSVGRNDNIYNNTVAVGSTPPTGQFSTGYWSSSPNCDSGFANYYNSTNSPYFCGYYAFDYTNTLNPKMKWTLNGLTTTTSTYLGEPWGKMAIGKVIINGNEKWVGFIGGGYNYCNGSNGCSDNRGKGFFVIDMSNGNVLWSYTGTTFSVPASIAIVDTDGDGFIDTAYVGDMGGNVWRLKFCYQSQGTTCNTSNWTVGKLYSAGATEGPIYTTVTGAIDPSGNRWIYWGTGDVVNPTSFGPNPGGPNTTGNLYAVKDNDLVTTYNIANLTNVSSTTYNTVTATNDGWYLVLPNSGEKMLSDPVVFGGVLYYTTYAPYTGTDQCLAAGTGYLYGVNFTTSASVPGTGQTTGTGSSASTSRVVDSGIGLATTPIVSMAPTSQGGAADLYVTFSGGGMAGQGGNDQIKSEGNLPSQPIGNKLLYWRDKRVQ